MFTYAYSQPKEYQFSLDSIHFAEFLAERLRSRFDLNELKVLDLCAGCGVIGIELSWYLRELKQIDFLEVQDVYTEYFYKNVETVNRPELQLHWHHLNYDVLLEKEWENRFDLIVSNPPYFHQKDGMLSPSEFKNRCRFFLDSSFSNFILGMVNALSERGEAYFLLRPLGQHGKNQFEEVRELVSGFSVVVERVIQIRGTDVVLIKKGVM